YANPNQVVNGVTGGASSVQLTTGWSLFGSYEHFWTPSLRTSVYGSYVELKHNGTATAAICSTPTSTPSAFPLNGAGTGANGSCNPNWSEWNIGTRSQWNITKDLYVGVDVIYLKLNSASNATGVLPGSVGGGGKCSVCGNYTVGDQDAWAATWRI